MVTRICLKLNFYQIQVKFRQRFAEVLFGVLNTATNQMHAAGYIWCKSVNLSTLPPLALAASCRKTICVELHPWLKMSWAAIRIFATLIS